MGCFSYICKESGRGVNSDSFSGELCRIYLLVNGECVEEMRGQYDSYGRVFGPDGESVEWEYAPWSELVTLHFNDNPGDGFAIVLEEHYTPGCEPTTISENDPDQGWNEYIHPETGKMVGPGIIDEFEEEYDEGEESWTL